MNKHRHNIYLVRHGQSQANVDVTILRDRPDHGIRLTNQGMKDATAAGLFLRDTTKDMEGPLHAWVSPYTRTRETYSLIEPLLPVNVQQHESTLLVEQSFGVCEGRHNEHMWESYPDEGHMSEVLQSENPAGRYWSRLPHGESQYDVAQRVHQFFNDIYHTENETNSPIINHIVIGHGVVNRAFVQMWNNFPYEYWATAKNPKNCEIIHLNGLKFEGTIFRPSKEQT